MGVNVSVSSRGLHLLLFPLVVLQSCLNGVLSQHWEEEECIIHSYHIADVIAIYSNSRLDVMMS